MGNHFHDEYSSGWSCNHITPRRGEEAPRTKLLALSLMVTRLIRSHGHTSHSIIYLIARLTRRASAGLCQDSMRQDQARQSTRHVEGLLEIDDGTVPYRGTSLIRKCHPLGPYSRSMVSVLWWSLWGSDDSCERCTPEGSTQARAYCSVLGGMRVRGLCKVTQR